jgi:hypothetical protein
MTIDASATGPVLIRLLLLAAAALVVLPGCGQSKPKPLDGKLTILVRPPGRNLEPVALEEPGALPVQSGGAMCLDARLEEPAHIYLVWLDSDGKALPLYPWNNERLEVTDIDQPPPERRPGKLVFSPLLGRDWPFGTQPGTETVMLLVRRTPLPADTKLGSILQSASHDKGAGGGDKNAELAKSATSIKIVAGSTEITVARDGNKVDDEAKSASEPLRAMLEPLRSHFELIHAIQFHHAASAPESTAPSPTPPADR